MRAFCDKHDSKIHDVLSCVGRMLFRGYLPIMSDWAMAQFLMGEDAGPGETSQPTACSKSRHRGVVPRRRYSRARCCARRQSGALVFDAVRDLAPLVH